MRRHGWIGIAILLGGEALLLAGSPVVATWFTPIMWTGYIVAADAVIARRSGSSYLTARRREFALMAVLSVLSWLIFEVYNFRLQNWIYAGVPANPVLRDTGYFWSFATITPALLTTGDLLGAFALPPGRPPKVPDRGRPTLSPHPTALALSIVVGLAFLGIPPLLPPPVARYTFAFVWIGFILLLEPLNLRGGAPSLYRAWLGGRRERVWRTLLAGLICGLLWEAWNYQALLHDGGIWIYTVPQALRVFGWRYGQMPVLGLLGFPPFAMESFAIYYFLRHALFPERDSTTAP